VPCAQQRQAHLAVCSSSSSSNSSKVEVSAPFALSTPAP
jgi:hypothetical protein